MIDKVFIYSDGGSRGNPGIAGSGTVVVDGATMEPLAEIVYAFSEPTSNNVAEYQGMIEGLKVASIMGASEVTIFMDSKLVVEQMSGRWKIKHPDMQKLATEAKKLAESFERVSYSWIPRAQNERADELSNVAMDASAAGYPEGIVAEKSVLPDSVVAASDGDGASPTHDPDVLPAAWLGHRGEQTRLILLRHGQTAMSAAAQYAGLNDVSLTEAGVLQARRAARVIAAAGDVDVIITSPLARCQETAAEVVAATGAQVELNEGLIECDFGDFEGLTFEEAEKAFPEEHQAWLTNPDLAPPAGESFAAVHRRVAAVAGRIVEKHPKQTVVIVSHVNPIKSMLATALGGGVDMFERMFLDLASISVVDYFSGDHAATPVVRSFNDIGHLKY